MANFEAFRWNFLSSTNSEIGRSELALLGATIPHQPFVEIFSITISLNDDADWPVTPMKYISINFMIFL